MRKVVLSISVVLCLFYSCSEDQHKETYSVDEISSDEELIDELQKAQNVFRHLYLPVEMSKMFEDIDEDFDSKLLRSVTDGEKVIFSNEVALAMGAYGVDLGYLRVYEQWNLIGQYLQILKNISRKIGISENVFSHLVTYFDQPVFDKDTLEYLANEVFLITDYNLRQNGRERASSLIILGGWLEALKMGTELYDLSGNEKLLRKICDQEKSLNSIVTLLKTQSDDDLLNNYLDQLYELQNLFHALNAAYEHLTEDSVDVYSKETVDSYLKKIEKIINRMLNFSL